MPEPTLTALQRGDPAAWRALFETYAEPLFLYAYHRSGRNEAVAEDVRQETFLAAIQHIGSFRGDAPLFGWLCGIARHKVIDLARHSLREPALISSKEENDEEANFNLLDTYLPPPEDQVVRSETRAQVVEALWSLPTEYRQALIWRYAVGESVEQVAARLGRTYKAIESLLSRARQALRERIKEIDCEQPTNRTRSRS